MITDEDLMRMAFSAGCAITRTADDWMEAKVMFASSDALRRFAALVAAAERTRACRIVTGLCISDNNAREINEAIRAQAADRLARHGIPMPDEDEEYGNPSF